MTVLATTPKPKLDYDATILTKSVPAGSRTFGASEGLGNIFVDVVDEYSMKDTKINYEFSVILQTPWEKERFRKHKNTKVVEHWYNSYPADMERGDAEPEHMPIISNETNKPLNLATVWFAQPGEGQCPNATSMEGVSYECLTKSFGIEGWYGGVVTTPDAAKEVETVMADPKLGRGKLYYNLFQNYDVLVALAKNNKEKLRYGNVQRVVSQMRSGVPVLVEVRGDVLKHFMDKFHYKCAFTREDSDGSDRHGLWTFEEAVENMKDPEVRRECQRQGLEIAKAYSPNVIGKKFLKTIGYTGDFQC
ncbi:MAG: hypothetical protein SGILL_000705 [Bacillariaceae sp.]